MRLEIRARDEQLAEQIDAEARRIPDQVAKLRHLRALLILAPRRPRWWERPGLLELAVAALGAALIDIAILVWILK